MFSQVSVPGLEKALNQYVLGTCDEPFDMSSVPLPAEEDATTKNKQANDTMFVPPGKSFFVIACGLKKFKKQLLILSSLLLLLSLRGKSGSESGSFERRVVR